MKSGIVLSQAMAQKGRRLTGAYHLSEDEVALRTLHAFRTTSRLIDVTSGRRIFRGPIFKRRHVEDRNSGAPYVSANDLDRLFVEPSSFILLQSGHLLTELTLHQGMILVTCSGMGLGKALWVRQGMDGLVASHDLIRIEVDAEKILPGYVFIFLSSRFGRTAIRQQIYGGSIKHIEPQHIEGLPLPRLGKSVEAVAHELADEAAKLRDEAARLRRETLARVHQLLMWRAAPVANVTQVNASVLQRRLDAFHYTPRVVDARESLAQGGVRLGCKVESVFEPNRGPRFKVDDPAYGVPFLSSSEVFRLDPVGEYSISSVRTPHFDRLIVSERDLLLPRSGQLGGIIGRAVLPLPTYYGHAASEHLVRVRCVSKDDALFLWSIFASTPGYLATIGTASGSSIPSLNCELLADMKVPWFDDTKRSELSGLVGASVDASTRAIRAERKAVRIVEDAIEEGAK